MTRHQVNLNSRGRQHDSPPRDQGRRSQGTDRHQDINGDQPRRSERLKDMATEENHPAHIPLKRQNQPQKVAEELLNHTLTEQTQKRPRRGNTFNQTIASDILASQGSYINHLVEKNNHSKNLFEEKRPIPSIQSERSETSSHTSTTASDLQEKMSAIYKRLDYEILLVTKGSSYTDNYKPGITEASKRICQDLLDHNQTLPNDTIFSDKIFADACEQLQGQNEATIFKYYTPLIVPSAKVHSLLSADHSLNIAIESVNEGWNNSIPIIDPRPQPDYAVGFRWSAFSSGQFKKLQSFVQRPSSSSYFMSTFQMYFPFLTCEVKCGLAGLDIADRQNLHSMTLAVRGVVELFRLVNRAEELHREVIAFSVSHDPRSIRIYGHFPVIEGTKTTYWRYPIRKYDFTEENGKEKWTAYRFTKNVYDIWMPMHFKRICSAIDVLCLIAE